MELPKWRGFTTPAKPSYFEVGSCTQMISCRLVALLKFRNVFVLSVLDARTHTHALCFIS